MNNHKNFSCEAIGAVEGQWYLKTGQLISLSASNLLDCVGDPEYNDHGCAGGETHAAFEYIQQYGIQAESTYKFSEHEQECQYQKDLKVLQTKGYKWIYSSEHALQDAVANIGPISVVVQFSNYLKHYSGGVYYNEDCSSIVNHAVLVVGYGVENEQDYWLIKNSHGESWGENGYLKLARNKQRHCGIGKYSIYPLV